MNASPHQNIFFFDYSKCRVVREHVTLALLHQRQRSKFLVFFAEDSTQIRTIRPMADSHCHFRGTAARRNCDFSETKHTPRSTAFGNEDSTVNVTR